MSDLTIELKDTGEKYLYQQIYEYIKEEIRKGKLFAGEKLPSTRSLAEYLQVARSTVDFAYGQLVAEGYLEARPCRGYFVSRAEELFHFPGEDEEETHILGRREEAARPRGNGEIRGDGSDGKGGEKCRKESHKVL